MAGTVSRGPFILWVDIEFADSSKAYTPATLDAVSTFGFRGEGDSSRTISTAHAHSHAALASMADLACMEISSRTARSRDSWSVIVKVVTVASASDFG